MTLPGAHRYPGWIPLRNALPGGAQQPVVEAAANTEGGREGPERDRVRANARGVP